MGCGSEHINKNESNSFQRYLSTTLRLGNSRAVKVEGRQQPPAEQY